MYNIFKKYFNRGQQIVIEGVDWDTHGYISQITKEGIWLVQLGNSRALLYKWDCFEIAHEPGFIVHKVKDAEISELFDIRLDYIVPTDIIKLPRFKKVKEAIDQVYISTSLDFKKNEIKLAGKGTGRNAKHFFSLNINGEEIKFAESLNYGCRYQLIIPGMIQATTIKAKIYSDAYYILHGKFNEFRAIKDNEVLSIGIKEVEYSKHIREQEFTLNQLRDSGFDKLKKLQNDIIEENNCTYSGADPFIFEGIFVDKNTFFNPKQGYIMLSKNAEIFI